MLYQALKIILPRPNMYLDRGSVRQIDAFINGFMMAESLHGLPEDDDTKEFAGFRDWVAERYEINTTHSWAQIIDFFSATDSDSVDLCFRLLLEYQEGKPSLRAR